MQKSSFVAAIVGGLTAFLLVSHAPILSADQTFTGTKVYVGEVPSNDDFKILKKKGITTVISLLDPANHEEADAINEGKARAKENGMKFYNFPMSADRACRYAIRDKHEARLAGKEAEAENGPVYIHTYRDVHRTAETQEYLSNNTSTEQVITKDTHEKDRAKITDMEIAYDRGQYRRSLEISKSLKPTALVWTYRGWSHYHLGQIKEAERDFYQAYSLAEKKGDANDGLGYCALREGKTDDAEMRFQDALKENPHDCEALVGMGYVRWRQGRRAEAIHYEREALAMNPTDYDAWAALRMMGQARVAALSPTHGHHTRPSGY